MHEIFANMPTMSQNLKNLAQIVHFSAENHAVDFTCLHTSNSQVYQTNKHHAGAYRPSTTATTTLPAWVRTAPLGFLFELSAHGGGRLVAPHTLYAARYLLDLA